MSSNGEIILYITDDGKTSIKLRAEGVQFRKWATAHLQEYLVKGFILDSASLIES
jgi:hypothetical protein